MNVRRKSVYIDELPLTGLVMLAMILDLTENATHVS